MKILGIESSCDETAAAVVEGGSKVLSSQVFSQIDKHKVFGGVIPEIAAREHLKVIGNMVRSTLEESGLSLGEVDAVAVTQGPGLIGALLVGASYAKGLALATGLPLVPVNHVHAHVHGALLGLDVIDYPCLSLVVSGGHTHIYYMEGPCHFERLAYTLDDACGECFDKVGKLFDLGYPGGPIIESLAKEGDGSLVKMPRMMNDKSKLLFSYSGLKTYMVNLKRQEFRMSESRKRDVLAAFQEEALGQLVRKLQSALRLRPSSKAVLVAGGVAANQRFRSLLVENVAVQSYFPKLRYCSDNAAMIAAMGYHIYQNSKDTKEFELLDWDCFSRYAY
tara:strand:- start:270 stop:1274 length:1005 start_codon:yes stop_codon:yes gene_type:complete